MIHITLVGNPNCGKTTLFNALTGDNQRVGNWSGVTVDKKIGQFAVHDQLIEVTDLPGVYSLAVSSEASSQDALIAAAAVAQGGADLIVNVVDACHLERHLYLTSQLLELDTPLVLVINMTDIAEQRGIVIDADALSEHLQCPVVMMQAHREEGVDALKQVILDSSLLVERSNPVVQSRAPLANTIFLSLPLTVKHALVDLEQQLLSNSTKPALVPYCARRILEGDTVLASMSYDFDIDMANARYQAVHDVVASIQTKRSDASEHFTAKLDKIVLHRVWAVPIFLGMMYLMFFFAIHIGGAFQDFFNISTDALFVQGSAQLLKQAHAPDWLIALCANGIGQGINTTLTFIPVMASMYFFLSLLESSGYMARAAFVVDKAMRVLGLPGKAFVPMIVGFGCNVPAIMAARTLDSERDRILTILMSPFMSCSARLAIYAVFVAAFFPTNGQNVVFSLYLIGIFMAVLTGFMLRKTVLRGQTSPLILELPAYHRPSMRRLIKETGLRLRFFIVRAGKFIIPVCVLLGAFNALNVHGELTHGESILSWVGRLLTPLFSPIGLHEENWPATVGLLTGTLAKEVVVGSLNTLYSQMGHLTTVSSSQFELWGTLKTAVWSIPQNLAHLGGDTSTHALSQPVYGVMYQYFDGKAGAYAYLLFILLYIPCVSTMAVIRQEASRKLMWFSITWSLIVAYVTATGFYQLATLTTHPVKSLEYLIALLLGIGLTLVIIRVASHSRGAHHAVEHS